MTRYMRHGACHAGRGHLLGSRRARAAEGVYSFCTHKGWCLGCVKAQDEHLRLWLASIAYAPTDRALHSWLAHPPAPRLPWGS